MSTDPHTGARDPVLDHDSRDRDIHDRDNLNRDNLNRDNLDGDRQIGGAGTEHHGATSGPAVVDPATSDPATSATRATPEPAAGDRPAADSTAMRHDTSRTDPAAGRDANRDGHDTSATPATSAADAGRGSTEGVDRDPERLVPADRAAEYGRRWNEVKGSFVDEPRRAVGAADVLVGELLDDLERLFREQRSRLEQGLDTDQASTEDLRVALRRYRSFFDRLLTL